MCSVETLPMIPKMEGSKLNTKILQRQTLPFLNNEDLLNSEISVNRNMLKGVHKTILFSHVRCETELQNWIFIYSWIIYLAFNTFKSFLSSKQEFISLMQ